MRTPLVSRSVVVLPSIEMGEGTGETGTGGWVPLEANPDVLNKYLERGGVVSGCKAVDVLGLESEPLSWVQKPVIAVLLLFPCSERYENHKRQEDQRLRERPDHVSPNVFHMKQTVHNACGTVALLHCIANNASNIQLRKDCWFGKFLQDAEGLDATARGSLLENCASVASTHLELATEGQSTPPDADDPVYHHFIAFVHKDGHLYELDGRKSFPINHGVSSAETVLEDSARVCREFMERDPTDVNFSVIALSAS